MLLKLKYFSALCAAILLTSASSLHNSAIASVNSQSQQVVRKEVKTAKFQENPVFQPILAKLKQKTKIRILLPKYIPESDGENPLYAIIETATAKKYELLLGFSPDCSGGTACRLGFVAGEAVTRKTPPLTGKPVSLAKRITGYFVESTCGANCSDATLTWRQKGVQYVVGLKAGDRASLVKIANSAINP